MTNLLQPHALSDAEHFLELARGVLDIEADAVRALKNRLGEAFLAAHRLLLETKGRVVVTGMGKSGHIGRKIASTLASTGTPAAARDSTSRWTVRTETSSLSAISAAVS